MLQSYLSLAGQTIACSLLLLTLLLLLLKLPQVRDAQQEDGLHCGARLHHGRLPGRQVSTQAAAAATAGSCGRRLPAMERTSLALFDCLANSLVKHSRPKILNFLLAG